MSNTVIPGTNNVSGAPTMYVESSYANNLEARKLDLQRIYTPVADTIKDASVVVINQTSGPITVVDNNDVHGYWYSAPVVPKPNGNFASSPFPATAAVGASDHVWIDAPPFDGYCTVGSWSSAMHSMGKRTQATLSLKIPGTSDNLWVSLEMEIGLQMYVVYALSFQPSSRPLPSDERLDEKNTGAQVGACLGNPNNAGMSTDVFDSVPIDLEDTSSDGSMHAKAFWFGPDARANQENMPCYPLYVVIGPKK